MRFLGAHTIDTGGIDMAARRAAAAGMRALQIFTTIPKYYGDKSSIKPDRVARFRAALAETKIAPEHVVAHAAYVLNLASEDAEKYSRASAGLAKELERSTALGIAGVCVHPGAGKPPEATRRVAAAIAAALAAVPGKTRIWVENTAGAGTTVGRDAEEIGAILGGLPKAVRARAGYGLDTCHLYSSGHDIAASADALKAILDEFEDAAGEPPSFFHLNDSEGTLGSNKDRHMLIGEGRIGVEPFRWLLADRRTQDVPLILETPQTNVEIAKDDASADPADLAMMELLAPS
ncbi:MAG TPA: deoxyribonuclease IV [Gemmatimonadaceae bacterium]|nr:deoxyribonuclease IV [Gemmatimonadaceae bacterium]